MFGFLFTCNVHVVQRKTFDITFFQVVTLIDLTWISFFNAHHMHMEFTKEHYILKTTMLTDFWWFLNFFVVYMFLQDFKVYMFIGMTFLKHIINSATKYIENAIFQNILKHIQWLWIMNLHKKKVKVGHSTFMIFTRQAISSSTWCS